MRVKEKNGDGFLDLRICDNLELMAEIPDNTIDLIYCDILYGTGKNFKDYQDLKPNRAIITEHYIPRIIEFKRILKYSGSVFLQMDYRISHWVRLILDDIFGYDRLINEIVWLYGAGGFNKELFCNPKHDTILAYSKTENYTNNKLTDSEHGARLKSWWRINSIADKSGYLKIDNETPIYYSQKPIKLIEQIISLASNKGDLVADFYSGSFTTAVACKNLNRSFIGCDINPNCFEKAKERGLFSFTDLTTNAD